MINTFFSPNSIAVIGASDTPGKIGYMPVHLLKTQGFEGKIYPVNPRADVIQGLPCFSDLSKIPDSIDLVIIAVPARAVLKALQSARSGQIAAVVIFSSGFAEIDSEGAQEQQALKNLALKRGFRVLGPNCLGFINTRKKVYATFTPAVSNGVVAQGNIGVITQSGAFGAYAYCLMAQRKLGVSYWITTGNESDIDVADCIEFLATDPHTSVIMAYIEGCKNGEKLKQALALAHKNNKRVVITKIGRTQAGAQAAASHTAALAGDDAVYDALFKQYGVLRTNTIEEFFNLGQALSVWKNITSRPTLGLITISGGVGALMADDAQDMNLNLPALPLDVAERLRQHIPFAGTLNPVDITGQAIAQPEVLLQTAKSMMASGLYGGLVVFLAAAGGSERFWPPIQEFVQTMRNEYPNIPLAISTLLSAERQAKLAEYGCLTFVDPSVAVRTMGAVLQEFLPLNRSDHVLSPEIIHFPAGQTVLNEAESLALLKAVAIPVPDFKIVPSKQAVCSLFDELQQDAVMKILSRDILHKSDIGGVKLGLQNKADFLNAYDSIMQNVEQAMPDARVDGVLVAPMMAQGIECIVGVHTDPVFGPVVMFGLGGVFVEIFKDVSFRLAPFDEAEALSMITETRAGHILKGVRGKKPADLKELARILAKVSQLAYTYKDTISSIDINPLVVYEQGQGAVALDGLVILNSTISL